MFNIFGRFSEISFKINTLLLIGILNLKAVKKRMSLSMLLLTLTFAFSQRKIGENQNGKFIITENLSDIKSEWKAQLAKQGISESLGDFVIQAATSEGETYYSLQAKTPQNTTMATLLDLSKNEFRLAVGDAGTLTVTCTGCSYGCSPEYIKKLKVWHCTAGCGYNCTKTETVTVN